MGQNKQCLFKYHIFEYKQGLCYNNGVEYDSVSVSYDINHTYIFVDDKR